MRTLRLVFGRCLRRAAAPSAAAAIAGSALQAATGTSAPWLHAAAFVVAAACCLCTVELWPLFARGRPGTDLVVRAVPGSLHGSGAAVAGALLALLALLVPTALLLALGLPEPRSHRAAAAGAVLDDARPELRVELGGVPCREVLLRPVALMPAAAPVATTLQVFADGEPVGSAIEITATQQLVRVPMAGRSIATLSLRRVAGNLALLFPRDGIVAVDAAAKSRALGSVLAFALWILPAGVALALALLLAPLAALPTSLLVAAAALVLQTLGDLGPAAAALTHAARGRWLLDESVFRDCLPSLGTGLAAMIAAMFVRAGARR
jgi:hypothetical protein